MRFFNKPTIATVKRPPGQRAIRFSVLLWSLLFAGSIGQSPLFSSNQNTYLLQGVSQSSGYPLSTDWLANQTDHLNLFSLLTKLTYSINPTLFYVYHFVLASILAGSLYCIGRKSTDHQWSELQVTFFFASFIVLGKVLPILDGVAGQYILGSFFQPSVFGVLLVSSVACFVCGRFMSAILLCCFAAYMHPTYLLQAGFLIVAYQCSLLIRRRISLAIGLGLLGLFILAPLSFFLYRTFAQVSADLLRESQRILVYERLPHHAVLGFWLVSAKTLFALLVISVAIFTVRKTLLLSVLLIPLLLAILLGAWGLSANSLGIALLFPQRCTVWLVPVACAVLIARMISLWPMFGVLQRKLVGVGVVVICCTVFLFGLLRTISSINERDRDNAFYRALAGLDFREGSLLIPVGREDVRLNARVPVFVDWKSHPYRADEVIAWYERTQLAKSFYQANSDADQLRALSRIESVEKIGYILVDKSRSMSSCVAIYEDKNVRVYRSSRCLRDF